MLSCTYNICAAAHNIHTVASYALVEVSAQSANNQTLGNLGWACRLAIRCVAGCCPIESPGCMDGLAIQTTCRHAGQAWWCNPIPELVVWRFHMTPTFTLQCSGHMTHTNTGTHNTGFMNSPRLERNRMQINAEIQFFHHHHSSCPTHAPI